MHSTVFDDSKDAPDLELLPIACLVSGLVLLLCLPIGMFLGIGWTYAACFAAHLLVLGIASVLALAAISSTLTSSCAGKIFCGTAVSVWCAWIFLPGVLPVTATDALVHHLAVPKWWYEQGRIVEIPWHEWSYYPMLLNLGFLGLMSFGAVSFCAFYHGVHLLLLAGLVGLHARRESDDGSAAIAVLVTLTSAPLVRLAGIPLVDLGLALYSFLAVFYLLRCVRSQRVVEMLGAGVAVGLAIGTKYNGLLFAAVLGAGAVWLATKKLVRLRHAVIFAAAAAVVYAPWALKNWSWTGNPVYPMYRSVFGGPTVSLPMAPKGFAPLQHRLFVYGESALDLVALPIRVFVTGREGDPRAFDGSLGVVLLAGLAALILPPRRFFQKFHAGVSIGYLLPAILLQAARVRYLAPIIPSLCVLSGFAVSRLLGWAGVRRKETRIAAAAVLAVAWCGVGVWEKNRADGLFSYLAGTMDREAYLASRVPEYPLIAYANSHLAPDAKVYLVTTGNPFYYFDVPVLSRGYFSTNEIISWARTKGEPAELRATFAKLGITHILVNTSRLQENLYGVLNLEERNRWNDFSSRYLRGIVSSGEFSLWSLES